MLGLAEIAFAARQNAENEHRETLKKQVPKLNFHHQACLYKSSECVLEYTYTTHLGFQFLNPLSLQRKKLILHIPDGFLIIIFVFSSQLSDCY